MRFKRSPWAWTLLVAAVSGAFWVVAAFQGYALEMIWLPAVVVGAAWPRRGRGPACLPRLSSLTTKEP